MYYGAIINADIANGIGVRVSLFVSGCTNRCKGCLQPETWAFDYGQPYTKEVEDGILRELSGDYYRGLTILGGEPFEPENQRELIHLIRRVRQELPQKDIWIYTGNTLNGELAPGGAKYCEVTDEILDSIDVLVDGRFVEELKNIRLRFKGSENQRVIDMKETRRTGQIVLSEFN